MSSGQSNKGVNKISFTRRFAIYLRDRYTCGYCDKIPDSPHDLSLDHVIPRNKGGTNDSNNITTACKQCNYDRNQFELEELVYMKEITVEQMINIRRRLKEDMTQFEVRAKALIYKMNLRGMEYYRNYNTLNDSSIEGL